MPWQLKFLFFCCGAFLASGIEAARADEGFLCDGGRIVYVKFGELEKMKQTDACVASYFVIKLPDQAPAAQNPKPIQKKAIPAAVSLRPSQAAEAVSAAVAPPKKLAALRREPPKAAEGTDFRNVQIINAQPSSESVFVHAR